MYLRNTVDKEAQYIKRCWLIFSIVCVVYSLIVNALFCLSGLGGVPILAFLIFLHLIFSILLFRCAYRKPGTRLLSFIISMKLSSIIALWLVYDIPIQNPLILGYSLVTTDLFLTFGWLFLTFQLRKINIKEKPFYKFYKLLKKSPDKVQGLIEILLNYTAREDERDDAAIHLSQYNDRKALRALLEIGSNPNENETVLDSCGESIAKILIKQDNYNPAIINKLTSIAKTSAYLFIEADKPEWVVKLKHDVKCR